MDSPFLKRKGARSRKPTLFEPTIQTCQSQVETENLRKDTEESIHKSDEYKYK